MAQRDEHAIDGGRHDHDAYDDTDSATSDADDGHARSDTTQRRKRRSPDAVEQPATARKPTYLARKEEKEALAAQIRALEARLDALRLRAGLPTSDATRALAAAQSSNAQIEERIHGGLLGLAEFQSLVARHLHAVPVDPMATFIHLPRDRDERLATLRAVRPMKLRRARELVLDRLRGLRATQPYQTEERFVSRDGDFHCRRIDLHPFRGGAVGQACGARALFDALVHYLSNREISITDRLGQLTLREHLDRDGAALWNHRVVSTTGAGYVQDLNTVGFAEFVDGDGDVTGDGEDDVLRGPYGVIAVDSVDEDELFPYEPEERVRKDVTAALLVCEVPTSADDATPVAVLKRCVFVTVHRPQFPLPPSVMDEVVANVASWSTVMAAFLRDRHAPNASS